MSPMDPCWGGCNMAKLTLFRMIVLVALVLGAGAVSPSPAGSVEQRVIMETTLTGKDGDAITCLSANDTRAEYSVVFPKETGHLRMTVVLVDHKGAEVTETYDNRHGTLPVLVGRIKSVTVRFVGDGRCEVRVYDRR